METPNTINEDTLKIIIIMSMCHYSLHQKQYNNYYTITDVGTTVTIMGPTAPKTNATNNQGTIQMSIYWLSTFT